MNLSKLLIFIPFIILLFPSKVLAQDDFDIDYDFTYVFSDSGIANVTQKTVLTNKKTNLYPKEYELTVEGNMSEEITGFDNEGELKLEKEKIDSNKSKIRVFLNQKNVGLTNITTFSLNYQFKDLVDKIGRVVEIYLPRPIDSNTVKSNKITVVVPQVYGEVAYIKPPGNYNKTDKSFVFNFDNNSSNDAILIGFGDVTHFAFKLKYNIENKFITRKNLEIVLPSDSSYQKVIYNSLVPLPENIYEDDEGNWIAIFDLGPYEKTEVTATGSALIYPYPQTDFINPDTYSLDKYLKQDKYWETQDDVILNALSEVPSRGRSANDIYNYVVQKLKYNYKKITSFNQRIGAKQALLNPNESICMEFTDTFIALARAAGIPAREVNGFAYTTDEFLKPLSLVADVLHSWPEYWDSEKKNWIAVDPTWGNTTGGVDYFNSLDFNHFSFVKRGVSSVSPQITSLNSKDDSKNIIVNISNDLPQFNESDVDFNFELPKNILTSSAEKLTIEIINKGGAARHNIPIAILGEGLNIVLNNDRISLPPFGKKTVVAEINQPDKPVLGKIPLKINVDGKEKTAEVEIKPVESAFVPIFIIISIVSFVLLGIKVFKKSVRY